MCVAVPRRVLALEGTRARVEIDGAPRWIAVPEGVTASVGGYVTVYAGLATETVEPAEAEERLAFLRELGSLFAAEEGA